MIIVLTGPTGVGKTKLSIALAKKYQAEIINADAMQVYKDLNIGTAKITEEEKENIPHHLLSFINISTPYSIYNYQKDARNIIDKLEKDNKNIIIVGGSALYIKAALYNYTFHNSKIDNTYENVSTEKLYQQLKKLDQNIKIDQNNRRRVVRALNYYLENNTSISENKSGDELIYKNTIFIGLTTPRENLYNIINKRVDKMINDGLLEEVKYFYDNSLITKPLLTGIGYKELISYLNQEISLEEAINLIKKNSRNYAKRQYTFMRNKMNIKWFDVDFNNFSNTISDVSNYIDTLR